MALRGKMNKKGQMHTIEALLALMLIIGVVAFTAQSAPGETQVESSMDTQLVLYGEDFLSILDMERIAHTSWLYDQVIGNTSDGVDFATNFSYTWKNTSFEDKGIFYKLELYNVSKDGDLQSVHLSPNATRYGNPPENAITVTRLVTLVNPVKVYEVRLTLWYI